MIGVGARLAEGTRGRTRGILEGARETKGASGLAGFAEEGARITQGTSGGPVMNLDGARLTLSAVRLALGGLVLARLARLANSGRRRGLVVSIVTEGAGGGGCNILEGAWITS